MYFDRINIDISSSVSHLPHYYIHYAYSMHRIVVFKMYLNYHLFTEVLYTASLLSCITGKHLSNFPQTILQEIIEQSQLVGNFL